VFQSFERELFDEDNSVAYSPRRLLYTETETFLDPGNGPTLLDMAFSGRLIEPVVADASHEHAVPRRKK
jgi:hypothetical protein